MHNLTSTNNFRVHNVLEYGRTSVSMIQGRLGGVCSKHPIFTVILLNLLVYMLLAAWLRYIAIHYVIHTETEHRFLSTHRDSENIAVGQAQLMKRNGTKLEAHGLFGYGYTVEFFKTVAESAIFTVAPEPDDAPNPDPLPAQARQQNPAETATARRPQIFNCANTICRTRAAKVIRKCKHGNRAH